MIYNIAKFLCGSGGEIDRVAVWTLVLAFIAWKQLRGINNTAKADFIHRFTNGFFNQECRTLIMLFEYDLLQFRLKTTITGEQKINFSYFELDEALLEKIAVIDDKEKGKFNKIYSAHEFDYCLLGYFEDLGTYEDKGLIDIDMIYDGFSWYMETILENKEIKKYLESEKNLGEDIWEHTKDIYKRVEAYGRWDRGGFGWLWKMGDWFRHYHGLM